MSHKFVLNYLKITCCDKCVIVRILSHQFPKRITLKEPRMFHINQVNIFHENYSPCWLWATPGHISPGFLLAAIDSCFIIISSNSIFCFALCTLGIVVNHYTKLKAKIVQYIFRVKYQGQTFSFYNSSSQYNMAFNQQPQNQSTRVPCTLHLYLNL